MDHPRVECRTPNNPGSTRIPEWKFNLLREAILRVVSNAGDKGLRFSVLTDSVRPLIDERDLKEMGSLGWHVTTVKLELEVRGEIKKSDNKGPQRLIVSQL